VKAAPVAMAATDPAEDTEVRGVKAGREAEDLAAPEAVRAASASISARRKFANSA
jgi:hypothetical protein